MEHKSNQCRVRDLLGKQANDDSLQNMIRNSLLPYTIVPHSKDRPTAAIKTHSGEIYSAEELVVCFLAHPKRDHEIRIALGSPLPVSGSSDQSVKTALATLKV